MGNSSEKIKLVLWLSYFTIGYNLLEGIISIGFGVSEDSFALAGFGGDSLIEVASAMIVLWRCRQDFNLGSGLSLQRERIATRGIGILFIVLSILTGLTAAFQLYTKSHPATTLPGIVISLVSLSFMFFLWKNKAALGRELNSATVMKDAACSLACIKLSFILLLGSVVYFYFPQLWWVDAVSCLALSWFIFAEGKGTVQSSMSENFTGGCGCHDECSSSSKKTT